MKPADALQAALVAAKSGQLHFTNHARESMAKRSVQVVDVNQAIRTATDATWLEENQTWRLGGGRDTDGDYLQVVLSSDFTRVVTVF